jgi:ectoine hydroxylase-related dioxygenase (phytanoyl-CoA dioxygenase family)
MTAYASDFDADGFCIIRGAIDPELITRATQQINAFRTNNDPMLKGHNLLVEGMLKRVVNLHYSVTSLQDVFSNAMHAGQEVCDRFGKATLYTSLFFEHGSQQLIHRDTPYFYSGSDGGYMGVWVALDDVDETNGALIAVKGSHRLEEPDLNELKNQFYPTSDVPASSTPLFNAYNAELAKEATRKGLSAVTCGVKKGDMILWHPSTLHGGLPHLDTSRTRRSFVMHITPQNMPIKHMDYFFHRDKPIEMVEKEYFTHADRLLAAGDTVDFRHMKAFTVSELGTF